MPARAATAASAFHASLAFPCRAPTEMCHLPLRRKGVGRGAGARHACVCAVPAGVHCAMRPPSTCGHSSVITGAVRLTWCDCSSAAQNTRASETHCRHAGGWGAAHGEAVRRGRCMIDGQASRMRRHRAGVVRKRHSQGRPGHQNQVRPRPPLPSPASSHKLRRARRWSAPARTHLHGGHQAGGARRQRRQRVLAQLHGGFPPLPCGPDGVQRGDVLGADLRGARGGGGTSRRNT